MASPFYWLKRIRRVDRTTDQSPPARRYDRYEPEYRSVLTAIHDCGGDSAIDELAEWIVEQTRTRGTLPRPSRVRRQGRTICGERGIDVPPDSPLSP